MPAVDALATPLILLAYDGSADAQTAIDHLARVTPGARTLVLTVWEPLAGTLMRTGPMGARGSWADVTTIDGESRDTAAAVAAEGAARAQAAGLEATPRAESSDHGVANTILDVAEDAGVELIVLGSRGLGGVRSLLLGSVSHAVAQHADRPVLVIPSAAIAERRQQLIRRGADPA